MFTILLIAFYVVVNSYLVQNFGIADEYVEHGNVEVLRKEVGLNPETIVEKTVEVYEKILLTRE